MSKIQGKNTIFDEKVHQKFLAFYISLISDLGFLEQRTKTDKNMKAFEVITKIWGLLKQ